MVYCGLLWFKLFYYCDSCIFVRTYEEFYMAISYFFHYNEPHISNSALRGVYFIVEYPEKAVSTFLDKRFSLIFMLLRNANNFRTR